MKQYLCDMCGEVLNVGNYELDIRGPLAKHHFDLCRDCLLTIEECIDDNKKEGC